MLLAFLHTVAVVVYLGGTVFLGTVLIPALKRRGLDAEGLHVLAGVIRIFHPVSLASLGLAVLTGAIALTPVKETLGPEYVPRIFGVLALKLLFVFALVLVSCFTFFALGPRLLRALSGADEKPDAEGVAKGMQLIQPLQRWYLIAASLGAVIVYLGLWMSHAG
ncbi:MAG: hypothetical protein ACE5JQ_11015 [Candidatus Methylomirabilales bacterium]